LHFYGLQFFSKTFINIFQQVVRIFFSEKMFYSCNLVNLVNHPKKVLKNKGFINMDGLQKVYKSLQN